MQTGVVDFTYMLDYLLLEKWNQGAHSRDVYMDLKGKKNIHRDNNSHDHAERHLRPYYATLGARLSCDPHP